VDDQEILAQINALAAEEQRLEEAMSATVSQTPSVIASSQLRSPWTSCGTRSASDGPSVMLVVTPMRLRPDRLTSLRGTSSNEGSKITKALGEPTHCQSAGGSAPRLEVLVGSPTSFGKPGRTGQRHDGDDGCGQADEGTEVPSHTESLNSRARITRTRFTTVPIRRSFSSPIDTESGTVQMPNARRAKRAMMASEISSTR